MVTTDAFSSPRRRWLRRASAAAIATAVLGIGGTGLSVAVVSARHSGSGNSGNTGTTVHRLRRLRLEQQFGFEQLRLELRRLQQLGQWAGLGGLGLHVAGWEQRIMTASRTWSAWSCTVRLTVDDPAVLGAACGELKALMDRVDKAASRFRPDSELSIVNNRAGALVPVSRLLVDLVDVSLVAGSMSGGAVDPTVGSALIAAGYDEDIEAVRRRFPQPTGDAKPVPGWQKRPAQPQARPARRTEGLRARPRRHRQGVDRRPGSPGTQQALRLCSPRRDRW